MDGYVPRVIQTQVEARLADFPVDAEPYPLRAGVTVAPLRVLRDRLTGQG